MTFTELGLSERALTALESKGIAQPTPVQQEALPVALEGRDVLGLARTGTGKTLAFALPIAERLEPSREAGRAPRALVLAPTRELALQVAGEMEWIAPHLRVVTVYGGTGYGSQAAALRRGADVVVATPGRAIDYQNRGVLDLSRVRIAVLDEADEMLQVGFEEAVETLLGATPTDRQTLMFSATLPGWARRLVKRHLREPVVVNVVEDEEVNYREIAIEAAPKARLGVLSDLLHAHGPERAIVFTRTKKEADEVARALSLRGHVAEAVHGDLNQTQRERAVGRFRSGQVGVLVATDVAARGLDIPEVDLVVHYRLPERAEPYQHRSGRTGRAGRSGTVILFHTARERRELAQLERAVGRRFEHGRAPAPEEVQQAKIAGLLRRAAAQPEADRAVWRGVARDWIEREDVESLAGLLAMVLGGVPKPRSLLTGDEGWRTLELEAPHLSAGKVVAALKRAGFSNIGRIQLARDMSYADVRPSELDRLDAVQGLRVRPATRVKAAPPPARRNERPRGKRRRVNA
ncbi:DEAD/DEAH box helicase [Oceanithermus sp.]